MTESMKFGPEWLRNISTDGVVSTSSSSPSSLEVTITTTSAANNRLPRRSSSNKDDWLTDNNHRTIRSNDNKENFNTISQSNRTNNQYGECYINEINSDAHSCNILSASDEYCDDNNSSEESYDYNADQFDYYNDINDDASQMSRYQLAEFRYGREEMLSLFDKTIKLPDLLPRFKKLFIEKIQTPLALIPNEEETRAWSGKPTEQAVQTANSTLETSNLGANQTLRGNGTESLHTRQRNSHNLPSGLRVSNDDAVKHNSSKCERNLSDHDDGISAEWTSLQRPFRSNAAESWRRTRTENENSANSTDNQNERWRNLRNSSTNGTYKWPARQTSWRETESEEQQQHQTTEITDLLGNHNSLHMSLISPFEYADMRHPHKMPNEEKYPGDDKLPEWALEGPSQTGGCFDASGAYHGDPSPHNELTEHNGSVKELHLQTNLALQQSHSVSSKNPKSKNMNFYEPIENISHHLDYQQQLHHLKKQLQLEQAVQNGATANVVQQHINACNSLILGESLMNLKSIRCNNKKSESLSEVNNLHKIENHHHIILKEQITVANVPHNASDTNSLLNTNNNQNKVAKEEPSTKYIDKINKTEPKSEAFINAKQEKVKLKRKMKERKPEDKLKTKAFESEPIPEKKRNSKENAKNGAAVGNSVAPWTLVSTKIEEKGLTVLSLSEIQKAELVQRSERERIEQKSRDDQQTTTLLEQRRKEKLSGWNVRKPNKIKSLPEIQAEESKARQSIAVSHGQKLHGQASTVFTITDSFDSYRLDNILTKGKEVSLFQNKSVSINEANYADRVLNSNHLNFMRPNGFWEVRSSLVACSPTTKGKSDTSQNELNLLSEPKETKWENLNGLGVKSSAKNISQLRCKLQDGSQNSGKTVEKNNKIKKSNKILSELPETAVVSTVDTAVNTVDSKNKKKKEKKKNKMVKLDSKVLGFSVICAGDRLNVGDRESDLE